MTQSPYLLPESFEEDQLDDLVRNADNADILVVAGDLGDDIWLSEDEATAILANCRQEKSHVLANYQQVGTFLRTRKLGRDYAV